MSSNQDVQNTIREYLLGQLDDGAREDLEQRLLTDDNIYAELLAVEDELVDAYLRNDLKPSEMKKFPQNLATPEGQQKLRFAKAFDRYAANHPPKASAINLQASTRTWGWPQFFSNPYIRAAAFAAVLLIPAIGVWRIFIFQSDVDKGLLALNAAYREQRPVEARITQLKYAPFVSTRGTPPKFNAQELSRAERLLGDAAHDNPSSNSQHALGNLYLSKKQLDEAIEQFELALKSDPNNSQIHADLGAARLERGKTKLRSARAEESGQGREELVRALASLNRAIELDNSLLEALFNRALTEQYLMLFSQAEQHWREYIKLDATSAWAAEANQHLKRLEERNKKSSGSVEKLLNDFREAFQDQNEDAAWKSLSLSRDRSGNAVVEALIDELLKLGGDSENDGARNIQAALNFAGWVEEQKVGDRSTSDLARVYEAASTGQRNTRTAARALMKSGRSLYLNGEWIPATEGFSKAQELFKESGDENEALTAEAWIGYALLRVPDPEKTTPLFERLSRVFEAKNFRSSYAQSLMALGDSMNARNEFSKALEFTAKSSSVSEEIQDQTNVIRCFQTKTVVHNILGNYQKSLEATFRGLMLAEDLPPKPALAWPFYHEMAMTFYSLGLKNEALQFEKEALQLAVRGQLPLQSSRSYDRLAFLFDRLRQHDEALKNVDLARTAGLKIKNEKTRTNVLAHSALTLAEIYQANGSHQKALQAYDEALLLYEELKLDIYKYRTHKGKMLAFLGLNDDLSAEAELKTMLFWFEQNREKIAEESFRNRFFDTDQKTYDLAVDFQYTRKKNAAAAFDYAESYRGRSLLELVNNPASFSEQADGPEIKTSSNTTPLTLGELQRKLPRETQLLEYAVMDDKVVMWLVTNEGLKKSASQIISRSELDEKIRVFTRELTAPGQNSPSQINHHSKELYSTLIGPVALELDPNRVLCIVPDGNLSFVPFAALISPDSGKFLIEEFAIQSTPSATVFIDASDRAKGRPVLKNERLLAVGNPSFDREVFRDLQDLPGAKREVEAVARFYQAIPLLGEKATATTVKQLIRSADVIHLATHAIPDEHSPLLSKLLLSPGSGKDSDAHHASKGFLQASEIYDLKLPRARLAVLSACQTGIERAYRGEGAVGLARPFIAAGVPIVVASLWPVESESTADLMISFHKHRTQDHVSTVEALKRAQVDIIHNQQPNSPSNFGWAAFITIGGQADF